MYARHNSIMIYRMQCIVRYIVLWSVLSKYWIWMLVRQKHFCTKTWLYLKQALHGFLDFELFKIRSNNYWNLWKTNNFALLHRHVCNKYLHLATSSTWHSFASHWLVFHTMQPMSVSHCITTHWPMLKFGGVSSSVESGLTSTSSLSNSLMRKSLNSPSNVLPSISFQENVVHLVFGDTFTAL